MCVSGGIYPAIPIVVGSLQPTNVRLKPHLVYTSNET